VLAFLSVCVAAMACVAVIVVIVAMAVWRFLVIAYSSLAGFE